MAVRWLGNAQAIAKVYTLELIGDWTEGDSIEFTINGKTLVVVAASTVLTTIASAIATAWNASSIAEFREATAKASGESVLITGATAGKPFEVSVAIASTAADATLSVTTEATGPNYWDVPENWDTGVVPVNADDVYIENSAVDILYGLDQHTVTLASLNIAASFTGSIGLPNFTGSYSEYRDKVLRISAASVLIGYGLGTGSPRLRLDTGTNSAAIMVQATGANSDRTLPAFQWKGNHASNTLEVRKGQVGVGIYPGDTGQVAIHVGYTTNIAGDVNLRVGSGITLLGFGQSGGTAEISSDVTSITKTDGSLTVSGAAAVPTLNNFGGTCYWNSTGALGATSIFIGASAKLDFSQDMRPKTVSSPVQLSPGAALNDPFGVATPDFKTVGCTLSDVKVNVGFDHEYEVA